MHKDKRIRKWLMGISLICLSLLSVGCSQNNKNEIQEEALTEITIPASFLQFTGNDVQESALGYEAYCTNAQVSGEDVVLQVTEQEKADLIKMNQDFIDDALADFTVENPQYSYELKEDFSRVTYRFDENIDPTVMASLLIGVTSMTVLNGIIENNESDWSIEVIIENCHTNKIVAEGTLPQDTIAFGESEWQQSYE